MSEEKYTGSMREVESLIDQFRVQITKEQQPPIDNTQTKSKGEHKINKCYIIYV